MKKFLLTAALAVVLAGPAFAEEAATTTESTTSVTTTEVAPVAAPAADAVAAVDAAAAAKEACTAETNEKVKLPENAGEAEKAQWDAAFAECVKGKGVVAEETTTETTTEVKTEEAAPAAE